MAACSACSAGRLFQDVADALVGRGERRRLRQVGESAHGRERLRQFVPWQLR